MDLLEIVLLEWKYIGQAPDDLSLSCSTLFSDADVSDSTSNGAGVNVFGAAGH